jgi:hypothetical protein
MCCDDPWHAPTPSRREVLFGAGLLGAATLFGQRRDATLPAVDPIDVAPGLSIVPRDAWGADLPAKGPIATEDVRFLLVHHTGADAAPAANTAQVIRSVYAFQTGPAKRWVDTCYQFFVDAAGVVWEGRTGSLLGPVVADATGGSQGFAQLVCLVGDFTARVPTTAAVESLTLLLAWLADRDRIDTTPGATATFVSRGSQRFAAGTTVTTATIAPHRAMSYTACPGEAFAPFVTTELQAAVHAARNVQRPPVAPDENGLVPATRGRQRRVPR